MRVQMKPGSLALIFFTFCAASLLSGGALSGRQQSLVQQEVALIQQASKYFQAKDYANAIQTYKSVIALNPKMAAPYGGLGNVYMAQGQYQMAVAAYKQYFVSGVPDPQTYVSLGDAYFNLQQYDQAIATYQTCMANLPPNSDLATGQLYKRIGDAYAFNKQYANAIAALQKSLQLDSPNDGTTYDLGVAFAAAGQKTEATQIYQQLQGSNKDLAQKFYTQITSGTAPKFTPPQPGAAQPGNTPAQPISAPPKPATNKNSL
jgi:tetratricopeptide (TPR) repeat protein